MSLGLFVATNLLAATSQRRYAIKRAESVSRNLLFACGGTLPWIDGALGTNLGGTRTFPALPITLNSSNPNGTTHDQAREGHDFQSCRKAPPPNQPALAAEGQRLKMFSVKAGLCERPEDWEWSSFRHYATGREGRVEIESEWTARKRARAAGRLCPALELPHSSQNQA